MKIDNTFYLISKIKQLSSSYIEKALKKHDVTGISSSHGDIIYVLKNKKEITMTEISEFIKRDRSTVTTLVSKLEKNGYVKTEKNQSDNRSVFVCLTEKGESLYPTFDIISNLLFEKAKNNIDEEEWKVFRKVLELLFENLNK